MIIMHFSKIHTLFNYSVTMPAMQHVSDQMTLLPLLLLHSQLQLETFLVPKTSKAHIVHCPVLLLTLAF